MPSPVVLIVPGYTGSGPDHWPSHWQRQHRDYHRVIQRDWDAPEREEWVATLDRTVRELRSVYQAPIVLVGHSLGCITIAHWARVNPQGIRAALLVAPPDVEAASAPLAVRNFAPVPLAPLPFQTALVASTNDVFVTVARTRAFASAWGSTFVDVGEAGHIATRDGYGPWPEGQALLNALLA